MCVVYSQRPQESSIVPHLQFDEPCTDGSAQHPLKVLCVRAGARRRFVARLRSKLAAWQCNYEAAFSDDVLQGLADRYTYGGQELEALIAKHRVTHVVMTPSALSTVAPEQVSSVQVVVSCGEPCSPDLVRRWPAFTRWSPADLRARFGDVEIEAEIGRAGDPDPDINYVRHRRALPLAEYIDRVLAAGESDDLYLIARNHNLARPGLRPLLDDLDLPPSRRPCTGWPGRLA